MNLKNVASRWTREIGGIKPYFKNSPKELMGSECAPLSSHSLPHQDCRLRVCPGRLPSEEGDGLCVLGTDPHSGQRPAAGRGSGGWRPGLAGIPVW